MRAAEIEARRSAIKRTLDNGDDVQEIRRRFGLTKKAWDGIRRYLPATHEGARHED